MKNILIPMDFTSVAMNALRYGMNLFNDANITVLHITNVVGKNPELFGAKPGQTNTSFFKGELEKWISHELQLDKMPERIKVVVQKGEVSEVVRKEVKSNAYDAIVMGTRDKYSLLDKWLGTISLSLVKTIELPIYLIPRYAKYQTMDTIVIASDSHLSTKQNLSKIANWNAEYSAFLNFLHIKQSESDALKDEFHENVKDYFEQKSTDFGFQISEVQGYDVCKSILAKSYNSQADLLMILPDKQSFLNSLMISSISKEMILSSHIPMLFFNSKSED